MLPTPAGKDQLTSAANRVLSGINVVLAAETVLVSPTTARSQWGGECGPRRLFVCESRGRRSKHSGSHVMVVFLQIGNENIQLNQRANLARCRALPGASQPDYPLSGSRR